MSSEINSICLMISVLQFFLDTLLFVPLEKFLFKVQGTETCIYRNKNCDFSMHVTSSLNPFNKSYNILLPLFWIELKQSLEVKGLKKINILLFLCTLI